MKALCFGSLNYDFVYNTSHFVLPKETLGADSYHKNYGGKGLNQSIALKKGGFNVYHGGRIGKDGNELKTYLEKYGVDTTYLYVDEEYPTGHAIIEVVEAQNRIITWGGANHRISDEQIDKTLADFSKGDLLLIQNEVSNLAYLLKKAHDAGMFIAFNTAPFNK